MRITQLSDIHIGSYMSAPEVRRAVDMANDLGPDLAVVTGDFLTGAGDPLEACIDELSRLRAPLGVWGCNGNHEVYARSRSARGQLFQQHGMGLLRQENVELVHQRPAFQSDRRGLPARAPHPDAAVPMLCAIARLVRRDVPNILLSHNPNSFPARRRTRHRGATGRAHPRRPGARGNSRPSLQPGASSSRRISRAYTSARSAPGPRSMTRSVGAAPQRQLAAIYVNRGLGTIGAPVRLGVPPEITLSPFAAPKLAQRPIAPGMTWPGRLPLRSLGLADVAAVILRCHNASRNMDCADVARNAASGGGVNVDSRCVAREAAGYGRHKRQP